MLSLASPLSLILPWPSGHDVCRLCLDFDVYYALPSRQLE